MDRKKEQQQEQIVSTHLSRIQLLSRDLRKMGERDIELVKHRRREIEELKRLIAETEHGS